VWAPPYDVIDRARAAELRRRHPFNIVRLTNPEGGEEERYTRAAAELESWIAAGVLAREERPAIYVHRHRFRFGGETLERTGFWSLLRLEPLEGAGGGVVLPHERTMSGPKADRLKLMRACRAQLSPVFFICADPDDAVRETLAGLVRGEAAERTEFPAGECHEIWPAHRTDALRELIARMAERALLIADGHHRYETALAYRDELAAAGARATGRGGHEFVMAYIVPENDPGLLLLPTHRVIVGEPIDWAAAVRRSAARFDVTDLGAGELEAIDRAVEAERGQSAFVLVAGPDVGWRLRLRESAVPGSISSVAFHEAFMSEFVGLALEEQIERVRFVKEVGAALEPVRSGEAQAAALLAPPAVAQVREAAAAGHRLPPKTTYFWPKVPTGVAIHRIDPDEEIGEVPGA
jgi:uncharacterized protein (DUF1015 family)